MAEVFRDALGIPHIRATDVIDLAFAQGEVTARDRGWQIEVGRLRAHGRLASLIGEAGVAWDVFARQARLDDTARRSFADADAETRAFIAAYAAGVRQGLASSPRAAEFDELDRVLGPGLVASEWEDHDPLGVLHVNHALFSPFPLVLWRDHVRERLGDEWVDVFAGYAAEEGGEDAAPSSGSNGWALHGSRTAHGRPIIAGDPHRIFELPGVYQQVRLACDEFDVVGLAFPGVPGVPHFGHTGDAAWGVTNAMAHSVDVFREQLRAVGEGWESLGPDGWRAVDVVRSVVVVRGGAPIEVEALETEHGTIVTPLRPAAASAGGPPPAGLAVHAGSGAASAHELPPPPQTPPTELAAHARSDATNPHELPSRRASDPAASAPPTELAARGGSGAASAHELPPPPQTPPTELTAHARSDATNPHELPSRRASDPAASAPPAAMLPRFEAWSVRMPARADADLGAGALLGQLRARTADEVISAFGAWVDPVNRVLAADARGAVRSATVGRVPDRTTEDRRLPLDATLTRSVATLPLPPAVEVDGVRVDANERPADSAIDVGWAYPAPHRARRIRRLLDELRPASVDGFAPVWGDTLSGSALSLRSFLPDGALPEPAATARDALRAWDARMDADSDAAGLFAAWRSAVVRRVASHPVLAPLAGAHDRGAVLDPWFGVTAHVAAALPALLRHPAFARDVEAIVAAALAEATDASEWGERHRMLPLHVLADVPDAADPGAGLAVRLSGDGDAVRCTGSTPGVTDRSWRGSVARWAWDLADREHSLWSVPFGASGRAGSPHFGDQQSGWVDVAPTRVVTAWTALTPDRPTGTRTEEHP